MPSEDGASTDLDLGATPVPSRSGLIGYFGGEVISQLKSTDIGKTHNYTSALTVSSVGQANNPSNTQHPHDRR